MSVVYNNKSKNVLNHLKKIIKDSWNFDGDLKCIELFSREGSWHTKNLFSEYTDVTLCEIDSIYRDSLSLNFPLAKIKILDSIKMLQSFNEVTEKYDLVSVDNPLGCFDQYCENFEVVENIHKILNDQSVLLINIVPRPYGYSDIEEKWKEKRQKFYSVHSDQSIDFYDILSAYKSKLGDEGFNISDYEYICRVYANDIDYFYYLCLNLEKK